MSDLAFTLVDIRPEPYAASPALTARLHLEDRGPDPVHAVVLRAQVRLEPQRRAYSADEAAGLTDLFGSRERWGSTLRPFLWMQCSTVVQGFTGSTDVDLSMPCTYDFEVAASRYLHALRDGGVPVLLMFSGTVFTRGPAGFAVEQIPWDREVRGELPVHVWRDLMRPALPGHGVAAAGARDPGATRDVQGGAWAHQQRRGPRRPAEPGAGEGRMTTPSPLTAARAVADAVLYEGYLLYPYRASAGKNQCRWQFGVLGPPGAAEAGAGEEPGLASELLLSHRGAAELTVRLRCLQLQSREVQRVDAAQGFVPVPDLCVEGRQWLSWDEAVEHEVPVATTTLTAEGGGGTLRGGPHRR